MPLKSVARVPLDFAKARPLPFHVLWRLSSTKMLLLFLCSVQRGEGSTSAGLRDSPLGNPVETPGLGKDFTAWEKCHDLHVCVQCRE